MAMINKILCRYNPLLTVKHAPYQKICREESCCNLPPCGNNPGEPTIYDVRKYGHRLPYPDVCPNFEVLDYIPSGVFRCTTGEVLGKGAYKGGCYQNPEYFSFHHMSYYDFHLHMRKYRLVCPDTQRKPP